MTARFVLLQVVGVPTVKFVAGEKLQTSAQELARKAASAAEAAIEASGQKSAAVEVKVLLVPISFDLSK